MSATARPFGPFHDFPVLRTGDRMDRREFHASYEQSPEGFRAQVIGGVVHRSGRVTITHGTTHAALSAMLLMYASATPGTEVLHSATTFLGDDSEPEPDLALRVVPGCGGRSSTTPDEYVSGPPELVVEIAEGDGLFELRDKGRDYTRYGVIEYLVVHLSERALRSFDLRENRGIIAHEDGVFRARTFPGLWINGLALFEHDHQVLLNTTRQGLAGSEHRAFVQRLSADRIAGGS